MAQIGTLRAMGRKRVSASVRNPYIREPQPTESAIQPKRTLFNISEDLERLNDLDEVGDDIQQQNLIAQWFEVRSAIASWMRMLPSLPR